MLRVAERSRACKRNFNFFLKFLVPATAREISIYQAKIWIKHLSQSKWKGHSICKTKLHFESEIVQVEDSGTCQVFQIMLKFRFSSDGEGSWTFPEDFSTLPPQSLHQIWQKTFLATFDSVSQVEDSDTCQVFKMFSTKALKFRFSSGGEETQTFL